MRTYPHSVTLTTKLLASAIPATTLLACSSNVETPPRDAGRVVTTLNEIAGPWDIARFDGFAPVRLRGGIRDAYVDVGATSLSYVIGCNSSGNQARIDESGVLHKVGNGSQVQTLVECGPDRDARDAKFFSFFNSRPNVVWSKGGRVRLFNGRTELILERPEMRRLANIPALAEITGRWTPRMAMRLRHDDGYEGWGFQGPYPLTIMRGTITYPGCGGASFRFNYTRDGRMRIVEARAKDDCGFNDTDTILLRVLRNGPLVERIAEGGIALIAGNEVVSLQSDRQIRRLNEGPSHPRAYIQTPPRPPAK